MDAQLLTELAQSCRLLATHQKNPNVLDMLHDLEEDFAQKAGRRGGTAKPIDPEYRLTNQNLTALNGQLHDTRERQRTTSDDLQNILYSIEKVRSAIPRPSWARREFARTRSRLGPRTRASSGIDRFDELLDAAAATAPEHHLVDIDDVGALAAFLVSDGARHITGTIIPVDGGQHLIA